MLGATGVAMCTLPSTMIPGITLNGVALSGAHPIHLEAPNDIDPNSKRVLKGAAVIPIGQA